MYPFIDEEAMQEWQEAHGYRVPDLSKPYPRRWHCHKCFVSSVSLAPEPCWNCGGETVREPYPSGSGTCMTVKGGNQFTVSELFNERGEYIDDVPVERQSLPSGVRQGTLLGENQVPCVRAAPSPSRPQD